MVDAILEDKSNQEWRYGIALLQPMDEVPLDHFFRGSFNDAPFVINAAKLGNESFIHFASFRAFAAGLRF